MIEGPPQRDVVGSALAGILAGFLIVGCAGGPLAFLFERKLAHEARRGWNLVPIVVWAVDSSEEAVAQYETISQRAVPEQFISPSVVQPDSASYVVGQVHFPAAQAGDPLLWSSFETPDAHACAEKARAAAERLGLASPELTEVLDRLERPARAPGNAP